MGANLAHELRRQPDGEVERSVARPDAGVRARIVLALGPAVALLGVGWAVLQPWRLTLLHPHGQGFWWLFSEPPLYVVLVGVVFRLAVARGLADDLEAAADDPGRRPWSRA